MMNKTLHIIFRLIMVASASLPAFSQTGDVQARNKEVIRQNFEAINRGDVKAAASAFSENMINFGRRVGREGIELTLTDIFVTFPDWRMEILEMVAEGDIVVVRCKVSGTHRGIGKRAVNGGMLVGVPPTGKRFEVTHIHWYKMRDGKFVEHWANRNDLGMMQQLGLVPPIAAVSTPNSTPSIGDTEKELIKIQNEWAKARIDGDVPYLENLYAKEFFVSNMLGRIHDRAEDIAMFATRPRVLIPSYIVDEDMKVSVYGDTAIVTGIENLKGTLKGEYGEMALRFTNVFVRRDGRWQLFTHHGTQIPKTPSVSVIEPAAVIREWYRLLDKQDFDSWSSLFTEDSRNFSGSSNKSVSHWDIVPEVKKIYAAFPDFSHRIENVFACQDYGVAQVVMTGTHMKTFRGIPPTNNKVEFKETFIFKMKNGKIQETYGMTDALTMMKQLGLELK